MKQEKRFLIQVHLLKNKIIILITNYNSKIAEIKDKIPSITGLVTNAALTAVENKITDISGLVKKERIMMQKLVKLKVNILLQQIIINSQKALIIIVLKAKL